MQIGLTYSLILHLTLFLVLMFGVDYSRKIDVHEETILLEMIPISTITNVKTTTNDIPLLNKKKELISKDDTKKDDKTIMKDSDFNNHNVSQKKVEPIKPDAKPDPKPEQSPKITKDEPKQQPQNIEEKQKEKIIEPKPEIKQNDKTTTDREKVPTKDIKKEPEIKKDKEKQDKKTDKQPDIKKVEEDKVGKKTKVVEKKIKETPEQGKKKKDNTADDKLANSVLKSLDEGGKKSIKNNKDKQKTLNDIMENAIKGDTTSDYDNESDLSMSEIAVIRSQISQAWRVTAFSGGKENKNMRVTVKITVDEDGEVNQVKVQDKSTPLGVDKQIYNAFVDSVIRAIRAASPLHSLPEEKYNTWNEMELTFDSSGMIY